jgi:sporulation protein YlmC with PRC-barrel domain
MAPETVPMAPEAVPMVKKAEGHLATYLIGKTVHNSTTDEAEAIGEINDLVISSEGELTAVVIGVGGFLGLGEKNVAIEYDLVEIQQMDSSEVLVVETTRETLESLEEFEYAAYRPVPINEDVKETKPATAEELSKVPSVETSEEVIDPDATREVTHEN